MKNYSETIKIGLSRLLSARASLITISFVLSIIVVRNPELLLLCLGGLLAVLLATFFVPRRAQVQRLRQIAKANRQKDLLRKPAKSIVEAFGFPLFIIDREQNLKFANSASLTIFGEAAIDHPIAFKFRQPVIGELITEGIDTNQNQSTLYLEQAITKRWFRVEIFPVPARGRKLKPFEKASLFALTFNDITDMKLAEQMRTDFIANASHELRTPLASLSGFIETLQGSAKNDATALTKFLPIMAEQSERMSRLIDDLLSLSRIEMQESRQPDNISNLATTLQTALNACAPIAAEYDCQMVVDGLDGRGLILGEPQELAQVFSNLIENACKYGQDAGEVRLSMVETIDDPELGNCVEVSVTNGGIPIPASDIPRLTERFYRAQGIGENRPKGTGLGLAIVKHIVNRHRGKLQITSDETSGTRVSVRFPIFDDRKPKEL